MPIPTCRRFLLSCCLIVATVPLIAQEGSLHDAEASPRPAPMLSIELGSTAYSADPAFYTLSVETAWTQPVTAQTSVRISVGAGRTYGRDEGVRSLGHLLLHGTIDALLDLGARGSSVLTPYLAIGATAGWYEYDDPGERVFYIEGNEPSTAKAVFGPALGAGMRFSIDTTIALTTEVRLAKNLVSPSPVDFMVSAKAGMGWTF